jgi:hypothetical protein
VRGIGKPHQSETLNVAQALEDRMATV